MPEQLTDEDLGLSSSAGLSDADLGLDTTVLPQTQMSEAANAIPMPDTFNPSALGLATLPPLPLGYTGTPIQSAAGTISLPEARHQMFQELKPSPRTVQNAFDVIDAYSGGAVSEPGVEPFTPPQIQEQLALPDQPISREAKMASGLVGGGLNLAETFSTPEGAALMFSGGIPGAIGKLVNAGFFADMVRQAPQVYQNLGAAFGSGDTAKITEALVDAVAHGLFTIGTGHGAIPDRLTIRHAIEQMSPEQRAAIETQVKSQTPGEQNAIPIRSSETLPMGKSPKDSGEVGARVPESKAPAETQSGEPSPAQPAETAPSEVPLTLKPAIQAQGQIIEGTPGKTHGDIVTDTLASGDSVKAMAAIAGRSQGSGFVGPDGKFRTRKEAEAQLKEQYGDFELMNPKMGLNSEDLGPAGKPKLLLHPEETITNPKYDDHAKVYATEQMLKKVQDMSPEKFRKLNEDYKKQTGHGLTQLSYDMGDVIAKSGRYDLIDTFKQAYAKANEDMLKFLTVLEAKAEGMPSGPERDAILKPAEDLSSHPQFFNEVVQRAEWIKSGGVEHAGRFKGETVPEWAKPAEVASPQIAKTQTETPLPPDVAPAYEHGHAVASNVPGLLIDPFGFQAAKIVGKAAKDLYDSPAVKKARQDVADLWNAAALKSAPKLTRSNRQLGEAGVRYASSFMVGRTKGQIFADKVLADSKIDPVKFGTALAEDNLRSIRAARDPAQAAKVRTLVGDETSPFKTEAEYQAFLNDPATKAAIERHQQLWAEQKDPLYRQANDLDPDLPLETRGLQTGARINLKALQPGETGVAPIGQRAPGFRQLATLKRHDPFGRQAKGSGLAYEGNYHEIMANGFERELPVAAQHEFLKQLIDNGDAVVTDKIMEPELELKGEGTAKGYLLTLKPYTGKFIHVRKGLADEFEAISGLDKPLKLPIITAFNNFMTRQSVAGLAEGATHVSNLATQVFTMPGPTNNLLLNQLIKNLGRPDLLYTIPKVLIKGFTNQRERMLELAEIGAAKEPYPGAIAKKLLNPIDQGVRLVSDDVFKAFAKKGIVENTETNRREFINTVGQYNKRLQPLLTRKLRETGLQPFITAGQTFNAQGLRRLVMAPGVKATNNARALALKADVAAGWLGAIVFVTALNLLLSKKATGPVGTPLGSVGWVGDDKKVHTFNVFRLLGYERGARITGLGPYIEAKRQGLSSGQALTSGAQSVASTGLSMAMGPGPRFAMVAGTGQRPTQPWVREAPRVPPSDSLSPLKSQIAKNIQTAMIEANPILSSVAEVRKEVKQGKPLSEALVGGAQKQLTRYSPQTRMSEQKAAALPKIVDSAQLRDYVDDVVKEARQLPMRERQHFINQKFRDDELGRKYRDAAWQQIERKGVLKYK